MDLEAAVGQRLAQILLHGQPRLGAGIHRRLEEAIGPAAVGLGGVHRQVGVLDQLVEIGAVLRRQRDADAGVGRKLVAEALIGLPDRLVDPRDEFDDVGGVPDGGLDHGEFVAAEPRDRDRSRLMQPLMRVATAFSSSSPT